MPTDLLIFLSPKNLILFICVFTRVGGLFTSAPLFSTYPIPAQVKTWLVALIAFIMFPIVLAKTNFLMPTSSPELTLILLKEFMIGYIIGFVANLVFMAVDVAANLTSLQMSLSVAQAVNPLSGENSVVMSQAYGYLAAMVFIVLNAHQWLFSAVFASFTKIPVSYSFLIDGQITQQIIYLTGQLFVLGLGIALPIFSVLLITDVLLGFVAKMMPQMNIFMVAMPLKIYIGLLLTIMFLQSIAEHLAILFEKFLKGLMVIF